MVTASCPRLRCLQLGLVNKTTVGALVGISLMTRALLFTIGSTTAS